MAEIETHYVDTFKNNVKLLSQQRKSVLEALVEVQPCEGKACAVQDQYGKVTARKKTERHEDTKHSETPRKRRWLMPEEFYTAELYDKSDLIRMLTDPQSSLVQSHVAAMERAKDQVILAAFFAAALTGETAASGTTAYVTTNDIAADFDLASTASGLTPWKLAGAKQTFIDRQVDFGMHGVPNCLLNGKAWTDMFGPSVAQFTSGDYNAQKPLAAAPTSIFYGGANLTTNTLDNFPANSTTEWYLPYWMKGGMVLGKWEDREVIVQRHPTKVKSWEVKITESFAATRVDEDLVTRIKIKYAR
jgi:cell fate (sporulation/competence/biofilm development) regulator YmcA (YheA/YmcA/DUF963 family)